MKTTETCNLNCKHCFTSGSNGAKIYFRPKKVINFFERLRKTAPWVRSIKYLFHGGEPMLAPLESLEEAYSGLKEIFPHTSFGMQTNLVYKLKDEHRKFFKKVFRDPITDEMTGFGTSWDYDIRFGSTATNEASREKVAEKQRKIWEDNVKTLVADGHPMTMIVCLSKKLIEEKTPKDIIDYAIDLGFEYILFERITSDGNATENMDALPCNYAQDDWLLKMFNQTLEYGLHEKIGNMFLNECATAYLNRIHTANRCRMCEQSLLTINATGTIAGCPNTAPSKHWGHIDLDVMSMLSGKGRMKAITCETQRDPRCYECPAFAICNGDCQQLAWQGDKCAAPQGIWKKMIAEAKADEYKKLIF